MTENNTAGHGPRGERRQVTRRSCQPRSRAEAAPLGFPAPTLPRGQEWTSRTLADRAHARGPSPSAVTKQRRRTQPGGAKRRGYRPRLNTWPGNPPLCPGGPQPLRCVFTSKSWQTVFSRSAGLALPRFLFSHRERGQETLDAAASRMTSGRRGGADDQTRVATAPCSSPATPPRGGKRKPGPLLGHCISSGWM